MKILAKLTGIVLGSVLIGNSGAFAADSESTVIDVRTPEEFSGGHVKGSLNIDFSAPNFRKEIAQLDRKKTYKLYCAVGKRSAKAVEIMKELKFDHVENLGGVADAVTKLGAVCEGPKGCGR